MKTKVRSCRRRGAMRPLAILFVLLLATLLTLSSCTGGAGDLGGLGGLLGGDGTGSAGGGQEPVYTGMTIGDAPEVSASRMPWPTLLSLGARDGEADDKTEGGVETDTTVETGTVEVETAAGESVSGDLPTGEPDQKDPFDQLPEEAGTGDNGDIILDEVQDSLKVEGATQPIYYAQRNQDVYITVHVSNPDGYEILSFTLNGNKYSSYMFEPGSDLENLILKVNVGDVEGVVEFTIDAIKYVDGTEIKDVRMDGDKIVRAGVFTHKQPVAVVTDEVIGFNDVAFNVSIDDELSLIAESQGTVVAVLYDGAEILGTQPVTVGELNAVSFTGLTTNALYQYAVVAYYDALDGTGVNAYVLDTRAFYTNSILLFDNVAVGSETLDYELLWAENAPEKQVTSLVLSHATQGDVTLDPTTVALTGLLSDNDYTLTASYRNGEATEQVSITFRTAAKITPAVTLTETAASQTDLGFALEITDPDGIASLTRLELVCGKTGETVELAQDATAVSGLLSDTDYTVKATYTYDLNDGTGAHEATSSLTMHTVAKTEPAYTVGAADKSHDWISVITTETDPDEIGRITGLSLYLGNELVASSATFDTAVFEGLTSNKTYTAVLSYEYDLNDGNGVIQKTVSANILTKVYFVPVGAQMGNTSAVSEGEYVYIDVTVVNPGGAAVKSVRINGVDYPVSATSTKEVVRVEIKHENQFSGGYTDFVVESLTATANGETHVYPLESNNVATVFINGKLLLDQFAVTDGAGTPIEYAFPSDLAAFYISLSNETGYHIDSVVIRRYRSGDEWWEQEMTYTDDQFVALSSEIVMIPLNDRYGGYFEYELVSITYSRETLAEPKTITIQTSKQSLICLEVDGIVAVSTPDDLKNMSRWAYYKLMNDLDLADAGSWDAAGDFRGYFDGNGRTIKNMRVRTSYENKHVYMGLFRYASGKIVNLNLSDVLVQVTAQTTADATEGYSLYYGAVASGVDGRLILDNVRAEQNVEINVKGNSMGHVVGALVGNAADRCYVSSGVTASGRLTVNGQAISMTKPGNSVSALPELPTLAGDNAPDTQRVTVSFHTGYDAKVDAVRTIFLGHLPNLTRDGYMFCGWYDNESFTGRPVTVGYRPSADVTLYAKWIHIGINESQGLEIVDGVVVGIGTCTDSVLYINRPIAEQAFKDCKQITTVYLGSKVTYIGYSAFEQCENLKFVILSSAVEPENQWFWNARVLRDGEPGANTDTNQIYRFEKLVVKTGVTYICLNDGTAFMYAYDGAATEIVVGVDGYTVAEIPEWFFSHNDHITSVVISEGVTKIGSGAFYDCDGLLSIVIPEGVTKIGSHAFYDCEKLASITLPGTLVEVGEYAFAYGYREPMSITLSSGLTTIGQYAFYGKNLRDVIIPASVKTVGEYAFCCDVFVAAAKRPAGWHENWISESNRLQWNVAAVYTDAYGVTYVRFNDGKAAIHSADGASGEIVLGGVEGFPVTEIPANLLSGRSDITRVTIASGITTIGEKAFNGTRCLVTIPGTVTTIGAYAFNWSGCHVILPSSVTTIGENAFSGCTVYTSASQKQAGWHDNWAGSNAEGVIWSAPAGTLHTNSRGMTYLLCADGVAHLYRFEMTEKVVIEGVKGYDVVVHSRYYEGFGGDWSVKTLVIGEGVTKLEDNAFRYWYELKSVTLPESLVSIGAYAFYGMRSEAYVVIPASVTTVASNAFVSGTVLVRHAARPAGWSESWYAGDHPRVFWDYKELYTDASGITYALTNGGIAYVCDYDSSATELTIGGVSGYSVVIPDYFFRYNSNLEKMTLRDGVVRIGASAFEQCSNLKTVTLPATLTEIGAQAFLSTSLNNPVIPASVRKIGDSAFACEKISPMVSRKPSGWSDSWFTGNARNIYWDLKEFYTDSYGVTYLLHNDATASVYSFDDSVTEVVIGVAGYTVTDIYPDTFSGSDIERITLPQGLISIGDSAFYNCDDLAQVSLPSTLKEIGEDAFYNCNELKSVVIPEGVTRIGAWAFQSCWQMTDVKLPSTLKEIGMYAFNGASMQNVFIPASVETVGEGAFSNGMIYVTAASKPAGWHKNWNGENRKDYVKFNFKEIYTDSYGVTYALFSNGTAELYAFDGTATDVVIGVAGYTVKEIPSSIFSYNGDITSVVIPEGVTKIGDSAFFQCGSLARVTFPSTLKEIGNDAFYYCGSLTAISLPEGLVKVGASAFNGCYAITELTLPSTLTTIGNWAFGTRQTVVVIPVSVTSMGERAFESGLVYVQVASKPDGWHKNWNGEYRDDMAYFNFKEFYTDAQNGVTYALFNDSTAAVCGFDGSVEKPVIGVTGYTVTAVFAGVFKETDIQEIVLPEGVVKIGDQAFFDCNELVTVTLPDTMREIGHNAFYGCDALESVVIPEGMTVIGTWAFCSCQHLVRVTLPSTLIEIGEGAFAYCYSLKEFTLPASLTTIGSYAFDGSSIPRVVIPASVTTIGERVFTNVDNRIYVRAASKPSGWKSSWYDGGNKNRVLWNFEAFYTDELGVEYALLQDGTAVVIKYTGSEKNVVLTSVVSNDRTYTITTIGEGAFSGCTELISVVLPSSVTKIGENAFSECYQLATVTLPASLKEIGGSAFQNSNLQTVEIPEGVTKIGNNAFISSRLVTATLPSTLTEIGAYAFANSGSLTTVTFAGTVEQWSQVRCGSDWLYNTTVSDVTCSNGSVSLN